MAANFARGFCLALDNIAKAMPADGKQLKPVRFVNGEPVFRFRVEAIRCGNYLTADGEAFEVTPATLKHWADTFKQFIGQSNRVTCGWIKDTFGFPGSMDDLIVQEEALYMEFLRRDPPRPFPGARELFDLCDQRQLKRGLVSSTLDHKVSSTMKVLLSQLARSGHWRDHFHTICTGDRATKLKPAPDLYLLAARELNVSPGACVAFEDSPVGVAAAHAAGCRVVAVPNIYLKLEEVAQGKADFVFPTLREAYENIDAILGKPVIQKN